MGSEMCIRDSQRDGASVGSDLHVAVVGNHRGTVQRLLDVQVVTKGGTISLTGHVRTWAEHDAVVDAAWMARGVIDVHDELQITG